MTGLDLIIGDSRIEQAIGKSYLAFDNLVLKIWPRVEYYRQLGKEVSVVRKVKLAEISEELSEPARQYLSIVQDVPAFLAYWEVQAQYCLIHIDAFGFNANSTLAHEAAADVGRVFQWLKAADMMVDDNKTLRLENLSKIKDLTQGNVKPDTLAEHYIAEEAQVFNGNIRGYVFDWINEEVAKIKAPTEGEKVIRRKNIGQLLGELEYEILKKSIPRIPDHAKQFFAFDGIAAACFDDLKDFAIDRELGQGYDIKTSPILLLNFIHNTYKSFTVLSPEEGERHAMFLTLGGLYQVRELIGVQERT